MDLKEIKETLVEVVSNSMQDLSSVDTHELSKVIDMIKDLSEAIYYCTIVSGMESGKVDTVTKVTTVTK